MNYRRLGLHDLKPVFVEVLPGPLVEDLLERERVVDEGLVGVEVSLLLEPLDGAEGEDGGRETRDVDGLLEKPSRSRDVVGALR